MKAVKITLKSDICVGSGFSHRGVVDSDICYDEKGIPFIPARRLKGCLREAAEMIVPSGVLSIDDLNALFGILGDDGTKGIMLDNAYIVDRREFAEVLESAEGIFSKDEILDSFASIKAQTSIDNNGIAIDNSLRYIRTLNRFSPIDGKELVFIAECDGISDEYTCKMEMICKALRHIGLNRTRGLGNVRCELVELKDRSDRLDVSDAFNEDGKVTLEYTITNVQPLLVSGENDSSTLTYIRGQMVQGMLASYYLRNHNADEHFEDLFVNGKVRFTNAYLSDENGVYMPTPLCIGKFKKTSSDTPDIFTSRFNVAAEQIEKHGMPKPLKTGFMSLRRGECGLVCSENEPELETIYHHRRERKGNKYRSDIDRLLYTGEAIKKGQNFTGYINGDAELLKEISELMADAPLRFGKSKTAQYGKCVLKKLSAKRIDKKIAIKAGEEVIAVMQSDAVFNDAMLGYTTDVNVVRNQIRLDIEKNTGLKLVADDNSGALDTFAMVTKHTGYYGVWNMMKMPKNAIAARSSFCFIASEDGEISDIGDFMWTGCMNAEGAGQFYLFRKNDLDEINLMNKREEIMSSEGASVDEYIDYFAGLEEVRMNIEIHKMSMTKAEKLNWGNSFAGRVRLMLLESEQEYLSRQDDAQTFEERIGSIVDKAKRESAKNLWDCISDEVDALVGESEYISKLTEKREEVKRRLRFAYMMSIVTEIKYKNS